MIVEELLLCGSAQCFLSKPGSMRQVNVAILVATMASLNGVQQMYRNALYKPTWTQLPSANLAVGKRCTTVSLGLVPQGGQFADTVQHPGERDLR